MEYEIKNKDICSKNQLHSFSQESSQESYYTTEPFSLLIQNMEPLQDTTRIHQHKVRERGKSTGEEIRGHALLLPLPITHLPSFFLFLCKMMIGVCQLASSLLCTIIIWWTF
jgi:hypothetical protein